METEKNLQLVRDLFNGHANGMEYFYQRLKVYSEINNKEYENLKVIGSTCIHVPEELIYATGFIPLRLCNGSYSFDQAGTEFLPAKSCPVVRSILGSIKTGYFPLGAKPELIVIPTSCDQKKKIIEVNNVKNEIFYNLEIPPTKEGDEAKLYWYGSVKKFRNKLQEVTGNRITKQNLKDAILLVADAQKEARRFFHLRKGNPVIWGTEAILIINTYFFDEIHNWTRKLSILNSELGKKIVDKKFIVSNIAPRIILTGSPSMFPGIKLPLLIEQLGGIIVMDEFCSSSRFLYDTVAVDEWNMYDMLPAIADRYFKPSTCPHFTPNIDRIRNLLKFVKEYNADGIVYQSYAGCHLYDIESRIVGREMMRKIIVADNP
ncbi:2-hydroxyacyl-CoA dehydratase, partial [candidate division KSB1 bacterium]